MNGFFDIHTHILPGVDDGARDYRQARELVRMAWDYGTRAMILTPHYRGAYKKVSVQWLREYFDVFSQMIDTDVPGMRLYLGNEIYYETDAPERLAEGRILSLNDSQYALLEFSTRSTHSQVMRGISETVRCGFTPVIAHVERYDIFRSDTDLIDEVLDMSALIQVNADSIMGEHGGKISKYCQNLLKEEKVHFIASDAHDPVKRPPLLRECFLKVHKKYGADYASRLFYDNAQAVIENEII